ncbi:protein FAR1-RELATED SEQUENCE 5-like isoform X1 [Photinus pyralis]|nr:protein FAR1-RELATED SEQUENCE 5-like isoform X1 [Photinus pyralis]
MKEGALFATLEQLEQEIKEYEATNYVTLQKRDSCLLSKAVKKYPRAARGNRNLKYYYVEYTCSKGGKRFKSRGKAIRKSSTMYEGCPMKIKFVLAEDGKHLLCKLLHDQHNHIRNKDAYKHFAKKRKLDSEDQKEVQQLLKLRANPKDVQNYIMQKTGKIILSKDIRNIKYVTRLPLKSNDLEKIVSILSENEGCAVEIAHDQEGNLIGIYYQDFFMKHVFQTFPELLICDATYKLNELNMALYILLAVDGNGQSEIVSTFLMADESKSAIEVMIKTFKYKNEAWVKTVTILTDKDMTERNIFKNEFPHADVLLCLFHTLRTFRREITIERMAIKKETREKCLQVIQKIAYSATLKEYNINYEELQKLDVKNVLKYYDENWHNIKNEWVEGLKSSCFTLNNSTTNRLESINQKIKSGVDRHSSLCQFYTDFKTVLQSLRIDRDHSAQLLLYKTPVTHYQTSSTEYRYMKLITAFAWSHLEKQFKSLPTTIIKIKKENDQTFSYNSDREGLISVTVDNCSCRFRNQMKLPCRHILAVRRHSNAELYDELLVNERWLVKYYLENHRATMKDLPIYDSNHELLTEHTISKPVLNQHQKFREASKLCNSLAVTISQYGNKRYREIMDQMKLLKSFYQSKKKVLIVEVIDEKSNDHNSSNNTEICVLDDNHYELHGTNSKILTEAADISLDLELPGESETSGTVLTEEEIPISLLGDNTHNCPSQEIDSEVLRHEAEILPEGTEILEAEIISEPEDLQLAKQVELIEREMLPVTGSVLDGNKRNYEYYVFQKNDSKGEAEIVAEETISKNLEISDGVGKILESNISNKHDNIGTSKKYVLREIQIPPKMVKCGRPKGSELTVIGTKRKRRKASGPSNN